MTRRQIRLADLAYAAYLWSLVALGALAWWYRLYRAEALPTEPYSATGLGFFAVTASGLLAAFGASLVGWAMRVRGVRERGLVVLALSFFYGVAPAIILRYLWGAPPLLVAGTGFGLLILWFAPRWLFVERRRLLAG
ncbi:MAG TPA: hypothetical protein VF121_11905 [Thermoanaerobaculia bacterium]|nr:hypothetical protein [Thermoanaerobaculia bacterium]